MKAWLLSFRDTFISLKLTLVLLGFSLVLIFAATLDQVNLGIWAVQEKFFRSFVVYTLVGNVALPIFPGGYTIGGLLLLNLSAAFAFRFTFSWRKAGLLLSHFGLIMLLVGELLTGLWQEDAHLRLNEGETKNYAESSRDNELAIVETTDARFDDVVTLPESALEHKTQLQHPKLPFRIVPKTYYPNSTLRNQRVTGAPMSDAGPRATTGSGQEVLAVPQPVTYRPSERNVPSALVELIAADQSLGTWLVSLQLADPQVFEYAGRRFHLALRPKRTYQPFTLTLLKFTHERYAGTEIPKNFSSRLRLTQPDRKEDREVLIYMNNPLRYAGFTFYQAGFENNDRTTVLQVVRNPSWLLPYIACGLMALGLIQQFALHLFAFVGKRRRMPKATPAARGPDGVASAPPRKPSWLPGILTGVTVLAVAATLRTPSNPGDWDLAAFGRLPTLSNGRLKPLDTVARSSLLLLQGRQRVTTPDGTTLAPGAWLLDMFFQPAKADTYQVFEIVHPDVLALFSLMPEAGAGGKRFSFTQLAKQLGELDRQAKTADTTEAAERTPFQSATVQLRNSIAIYQHLQSTFIAPGSTGFLDQLAQLESALPALASAMQTQGAGALHSSGPAALALELGRSFAVMETFGFLHPIPTTNPTADGAGWKTAGAAWTDSFAQGRVAPAALAYAALGRAWIAGQPVAFNDTVHTYQQSLATTLPGAMRKGAVEARFNSSQPFYTSMVLYVAAFLVALVSWLRWPDVLGRTAFNVVLIAFVVATVGIAARMWIESRPPVTNLYSSALFVGWGAVGLCLVLEFIYRNAIGSVAAGLIGFATLLIAHHLSLGGDTMETMRAVLDSNFWLATHVVTITVGYSATFLAGFLAIIFVVRGLFTRSLDAATGDALVRMIYGIVCFATLFSLVGTVLGGIWADQSWGRFWGWDPKENGALLIVIWNAIILHARISGLVRQRGLAVLAIFGNVVTAWSWFGVNMLGVGLHSYGFMGAAFWWLTIFAASQVVLMALAAVPLEKWKSMRARQEMLPAAALTGARGRVAAR
ncbi:cytochrome c biogenesis protein CcsA [Horticoccus sp. 23ND18S-11]|uniref:cytochrome c biogenesis protein CcsA n=1 Tax=Horticoccus sp. 23ND18S-11 TaxID=3391832 RepID=UPI0039C8EE25